MCELTFPWIPLKPHWPEAPMAFHSSTHPLMQAGSQALNFRTPDPTHLSQFAVAALCCIKQGAYLYNLELSFVVYLHAYALRLPRGDDCHDLLFGAQA